MGILDILITYLAIGSAFAMRSYFRSRHRSATTRIRAVAVELAFWLPRIFINFFHGRIERANVRSRTVSALPPVDLTFKDGFLALGRTASQRHLLEEVLDRYVALQTALRAGPPPRGSQFEIFAVAGNQNTPTGTSCLARKNRRKLQLHCERTADDLIRLARAIQNGRFSPEDLSDRLTAVFDAFEDSGSVTKLSIRDLEASGAPETSGVISLPLSHTAAK